MKISVVRGSIQETQADTIIVNLFEGAAPSGAAAALDRALNGAIADLLSGGDFKGKANETAVIYPRGVIPARRVIVVGLGKPEAFDLEAARRASATAVKKARDLNAKNAATIVHGAGAGGLDPAAAAQATAEGALLGLYRYAAAKSSQPEQNDLESLALVEFDADKFEAVQAGVKTAEALAEGVSLARNLVNMPPNQATPTHLAQVAGQIAQQFGLKLTVGDRDWAAERKMGGFLAVAKGAGEPPCFIVLEYNADRVDLPTIALVGKGITFDTGGISLKPGDKMDEMKSDMAGAAAVLGAMQVIGRLNLPLHVVGITPCTENMPDANGYHPADVITFSNGKTAEIISTDAEGRMILGDALVYAQQYKPQAVIDLATLTGACVIALGDGVAAGLFCTQDSLRDKLLASAATTFERLWPMPLWDDYKEKIKSQVADMKNTGGRSGGVGTSAIFLKEFTDYPWAHVDMAGMALAGKAGEYLPQGGTGYGVRLLIDLLRNWA